MTHLDFLKEYPTESYDYYFECDSCDLAETRNGYEGSITYRWIIRLKEKPLLKTRTYTETITGEFSKLELFTILNKKGVPKVYEMVDLESEVLPFNQNYRKTK